MFDAKYKAIYLTDDLFLRIDAFWEWFELQHPLIEKLIDEKNKTAFTYIDRELKKVFKEYKRNLSLALGFRNGFYQLYIYFGHNSYILTVGDELYNRMPKFLKEKWMLFIEK